MAEETLYCPSCNQKVRVPEELLGQPVQCPLCRLVFTAPVRGGPPAAPPLVAPAPAPPPGQAPYGQQGPAPAPPGQAPYQPYGQPAPYQPYGQPPMPPAGPSAAAAAVRGPGIALIVVGVAGLIINTFGVVLTGWFLYRGGDDMLDSLDRGGSPPFLRELMKQNFSPEGLRQSLIMHAIFLIVSVVICHGATQMMRLHSFGLAVAASILAMVNISNCCCVVGLPIGIWALVVLFQPGVRSSFEQTTGSG